MPDPYFLAFADQVTSLLGFLVQTAGDVTDQAVAVAQAGGEAVESGNLGAAEDLGGNFDPITGETDTGVAADGGDAGVGTDGAAANGANGAGAARQPGFFEALFANPLLLFGGLMLLLYVMVLGPERRKQAEIAKKRAAL